MNEQKLRELNKKLAEWAGFKVIDFTFSELGVVWTYPDGSHCCDGSKLPFDFTQSFDACLKWLIPRLWICNITLEDAIFWYVEVSIPDYHGPNKHGIGKVVDEKLTLALCLAIEKLIE